MGRMCLAGMYPPDWSWLLMAGQLALAGDAEGAVGVPMSRTSAGSPQNLAGTYTHAAYTATLPPSCHFTQQLVVWAPGK